MSPAVDYFDLDGDWAQRHPVKLQKTTVHGFVLPAQQLALKNLCQRWINDRPSNGAVRVEPLLPAVILAYADIAELRSGDAQHGTRGFLRERDVGFFLPVRLHAGGTSRIACLIPYLFVDNVAGVIAGREIYGFAKTWGEIAYTAAPFDLTVRASTFPQYKATQAATLQSVIELRAAKVALGVQFGTDIIAVTKALAGAVFAALKAIDPKGVLGAPPDGFEIIRLLFLKQFRDVATSKAACHQSIVEATGVIDGFTSAGLLVGDFELTLPLYDQPRIADTLGLDRVTRAVLGFSVGCDLTVPLGTELWRA